MTDATSSAPDGEELEELEEEIQEVRQRLDHEQGVDGPHFIDDGEVDDEVVDDTIAPPG